MELYKLTANRPRFQPGFEEESLEVEEMPLPPKRKSKIKIKSKINTLHLYLALTGVAIIFWLLVCCVILP